MTFILLELGNLIPFRLAFQNSRSTLVFFKTKQPLRDPIMGETLWSVKWWTEIVSQFHTLLSEFNLYTETGWTWNEHTIGNARFWSTNRCNVLLSSGCEWHQLLEFSQTVYTTKPCAARSKWCDDDLSRWLECNVCENKRDANKRFDELCEFCFRWIKMERYGWWLIQWFASFMIVSIQRYTISAYGGRMCVIISEELRAVRADEIEKLLRAIYLFSFW